MKGFSLIELLIVVALIAILSIIAAVSYIGTLKVARDGTRKADVIAIATALEVNKTPDSYTPLQISQFTHLSTQDPSGNVYCISTLTEQTPVVLSPWGLNCPAQFGPVAPGAPSGIFTKWLVCTYLEKPDDGASTNTFCWSNHQ